MLKLDYIKTKKEKFRWKKEGKLQCKKSAFYLTYLTFFVEKSPKLTAQPWFKLGMHDLDNIAAVTAGINPPTSQTATINGGGCKSCGEKRKFDEIRRSGGINGSTASIKPTHLPFDKKYRVSNLSKAKFF